MVIKIKNVGKTNILILLAFLMAIGIAYFYFKKDIVPLSKSWEIAIPNQEIPKGLISLKAEDCAVCHRAHYDEWKISTHAHAWTDLQFQAELRKESSPFLCINCHIPLQNQQEFIVTGLINGDIYQPVKKKNPLYDPTYQLEGISCATCHVRNGYIIGTIGSTKAPHPVKKDSLFLNETLCLSCHNANAVVTPQLACTFQTGDEWKAGPYYGSKNCITCHMDTLNRELAFGMGERKSHRHWFPGSGIPKRKGAESIGLSGMSFYPQKLSQSVNLGDSISYTLQLVNEFAGHRLPSGDPERFYLIELQVKDESGNLIAKNIDRIGEKWEWHPIAKKISDNNMNPGERRSYSIRCKPSNKGKYHIDAKVTKHRMDEKTAEYNKLGDEYPLMITVFEENHEVVVK